MVFTSMNSSISTDSQNTNPWGYHLILDCMKCNIASVTCPERIKDFCNDLINKIKMKPFGEPIIHRFAEHNSEAAGYSLIQLIETSNISAHFSDLTGDAYIDIFSCKSFDEKAAKLVVKKHFQPVNIKVLFISRNARN